MRNQTLALEKRQKNDENSSINHFARFSITSDSHSRRVELVHPRCDITKQIKTFRLGIPLENNNEFKES